MQYYVVGPPHATSRVQMMIWARIALVVSVLAFVFSVVYVEYRLVERVAARNTFNLFSTVEHVWTSAKTDDRVTVRSQSRSTTEQPRTLERIADDIRSTLQLSPPVETPARRVTAAKMPADGWPTLPGAPAEYTIAFHPDEEEGDAKGGQGFRKFTNEQMESRMAAVEASGHVRYQYPRAATPRDGLTNSKIFGLVAVRNVADNIALFLEILANFTGERLQRAFQVWVT
jgi:hypothetical protein